MPRATANGVEIEYETCGSADDPALLLIMGLGAQLTLWPDEFCNALAERGFHVIRYDNRDIGLSTKFDHAGQPNMLLVGMAAMSGMRAPIPYTLDDMAADGIGLLDALGIDRAHVVGASMGGMIAQLMAINHPQRVLSLTSIMSTTGNPLLPSAKPEAMQMLTKRPVSASEEEMVEYGIKLARMIGSPAYPATEERLRARVLRDYRRSYFPTGFSRQMAAIVANGDRRARLKKITAPALVIHGDADPLIPIEGGKDTAANIPGAELLVIPGMGHNIPLELVDEIADAIEHLAARAAARA